MSPKSLRWSLVPMLALAVFAACSDQGALTEQLVGPDQASFGKGKENAPGLKKKGEVKVRGRNGHETTYYLVDGTGGLTATRRVYPGRRTGEVVEIAIPEVGGLLVPVTAVNKPTDFTITTVKRTAADGASYVAFDLHAVSADASKTDVGKNGFAADVTLFLNKPTTIAAVSGATILWETSTNQFQEVQCRSTGGAAAEGAACVTDTGSSLQARLRHFSAYVIAYGDD